MWIMQSEHNCPGSLVPPFFLFFIPVITTPRDSGTEFFTSRGNQLLPRTTAPIRALKPAIIQEIMISGAMTAVWQLSLLIKKSGLGKDETGNASCIQSTEY